MKHVIVLDSDADCRMALSDYLRENSIRVTEVESFRQLKKMLACEIADALVIDVRSTDDLEMIAKVSLLTAAPIIVQSGSHLEEDQKVRGLEAGAADYISKPFGFREFLARVRVAMRETRTSESSRGRRSYSFDSCTLLVRQRSLRRPGVADVKLTAAEFNLLVAFLQAPRRVLSREQLLAASRVHQEEIHDRSLDALILRLRRKVELEPTNPRLIKTRRGAGYILESDVSIEHSRHMRL